MSFAKELTLDDLKALLADPAGEPALGVLLNKPPPHPIVSLRVRRIPDPLYSWREGPLRLESRVVDFKIRGADGELRTVSCDYFAYVVLVLIVLAGGPIGLHLDDDGRECLKVFAPWGTSRSIVFGPFVLRGDDGRERGNQDGEPRKPVEYRDGNTLNICNSNLRGYNYRTVNRDNSVFFALLTIALDAKGSAFVGTPAERMKAATSVFTRAIDLMREEQNSVSNINRMWARQRSLAAE